MWPCFSIFYDFFSLTIPFIPLGMKGQVFAFSWGNALTSMPLYGHSISKASVCKAEQSLASWLLLLSASTSYTWGENSRSFEKKVTHITHQQVTEVIPLLQCESLHNHLLEKRLMLPVFSYAPTTNAWVPVPHLPFESRSGEYKNGISQKIPELLTCWEDLQST